MGILLCLLLAACGTDPTAIPSSGGATSGQTTGAKSGLQPLVGANGQITVVAPPATGQKVPGIFFWVKENNIWESGDGVPGVPPVTSKDLGGKQLTQATALALAKAPALSPDGTKLAYAYSPEPEGSAGNLVIGQDIYLMDLKSGSSSILIKRDDPRTFLDNPAWSKDGKYIFFDSRVPKQDASNGIIGETVSINRYDMATQQREKLLEDAREAEPMPDGKQVAFIAVGASTGTYDTSLKLLDLSTKQVTKLATSDDGFATVYHPVPSPDGQLIAFAGAGGPDLNFNVTPTPKTSLSLPGSPLGMTALLWSPFKAPAAHGLPFDVWIIKPDGSGLKRLTTLFEDQPMAAWSKDGKKMLFLAGQGFYMVNADGSNLVKISDQGAHSGFEWRD